jgi:PST family polysaccharide transporter
MAHANVATAILGTLATIALVYFMGERGVVLSIVAGTAIGLALSWWYVRRIRSPRVRLSRSDVTQEAGNLLKLGFAFMLSGVLMMGAGYAVRSLIVHFDSLHSAGLYQAAWAIGGMYVAFILQAMGTDFYPRLVSVIASHTDCNQVVNEQAHVSLLLAGPGVVGTILLAPWIATLLYREEFAQASELLRWLCLGTALRVVTWPMGYIIVAANNRRFFVGTELAWALVNVGLTWWLVQLYGLSGAGVAFFLSYVFHGTLVYPVVRRMTGFRWSRENLRTGVIFLASTSVAFVSCHVLPPLSAAVVGTLTLLFSVFFSLRSIWQLTSMHIMPNRIRRLIAWVHKLGTWRR